MNVKPTNSNIEQAELSVNEITYLAENIMQLGAEAIQEAGPNETLALRLDGMRKMASLAGYHADLAYEKITGTPGSRSAEEWLCSPAYVSLNDATSSSKESQKESVPA